jgi:hypothetical protein
MTCTLVHHALLNSHTKFLTQRRRKAGLMIVAIQTTRSGVEGRGSECRRQMSSTDVCSEVSGNLSASRPGYDPDPRYER